MEALQALDRLLGSLPHTLWATIAVSIAAIAGGFLTGIALNRRHRSTMDQIAYFAGDGNVILHDLMNRAMQRRETIPTSQAELVAWIAGQVEWLRFRVRLHRIYAKVIMLILAVGLVAPAVAYLWPAARPWTFGGGCIALFAQLTILSDVFRQRDPR